MLRPREIFRSVSYRLSLRAALIRSASALPFAALQRRAGAPRPRLWANLANKTWFRAGLRVGLVLGSLGLFVSAGSFPLAVLAQQTPTLKLATPGSLGSTKDENLQPLPSLTLSSVEPTSLDAIPALPRSPAQPAIQPAPQPAAQPAIQPAAQPAPQLAQASSEAAPAIPSLTTEAPAALDSNVTLVAQNETDAQALDNLRQELETARFELAKAEARIGELQVLAAQAKQSEPVIAQQKSRIQELSDLTDQLKSQNTAMMTKLGQPRLSLPADQWDYRVTFASGSARISPKQKHGLRSNLPNRPIGGCLVVVGSTDDQAVKLGGQVSSNAELSALRALRVQALIQRMDPALRETSLLLGLSTFVEPGLSDDERRSVVLRWADQDCASMISLGKPSN